MVTTELASSGYVSAITLNGTALSKNGNGQYVLDASSLSDGNYLLKVTSKDAAGNTGTFTKDFAVDADGPKDAIISVSGEASAIMRLRLRRQSPSMSVLVTRRHIPGNS